MGQNLRITLKHICKFIETEPAILSPILLRHVPYSKEAIELDPQFANGIWLVGLHPPNGCLVWAPPNTSRSESFKKGFESAKKGIAIDDSQGFCHAMIAQFYLMKRQYDKANAEGEKAVALNPNDALVTMWYGMSFTNCW